MQQSISALPTLTNVFTIVLLLSFTVTLFTPRVSAETVEIKVPDLLRDLDTYCLPVVRLSTVMTKEEFALTPLVVTFSLVFAARCLRPMIYIKNRGAPSE
jgi:hypothetical protein